MTEPLAQGLAGRGEKSRQKHLTGSDLDSGSAPHPNGSQFLAHPSPFFLSTPILEETLGDEKRGKEK